MRINKSKKKVKQIEKSYKFSLSQNHLIIVIIFVLIWACLFLFNSKINSLFLNNNAQNQPALPTETPVPTPTSTPVPTIAPKLQQKTTAVPTVNPDPIINCKAPVGSKCAGQSLSVKKSVCSTNFSSCCQIGSLWKMMTRAECNAAQATNTRTAPTTPYPPCTIYYSALGYSRTYSISPSLCSTLKQQASSNSPRITQAPANAPVPIPTLTDNEILDRLGRLLADCINQAYSEYNSAMAPLISGNTTDSSMGYQIQAKRDSDIQACHQAYDPYY